MKFFFVFIFLINNSFGRDLNYQEKLALLTYKNTVSVKDFMVRRIDPQQLSIPDYLSFSILKKSCTPLNLLLRKIQNENEDFKDQSKMVRGFYQACAEGSLGLSAFYVKQAE